MRRDHDADDECGHPEEAVATVLCHEDEAERLIRYRCTICGRTSNLITQPKENV